MYTSYNYYESGYLMGRDPKLSEDEFAELLYQADKSTQQAAEQGGVLQSYSNDGESGTFDLSQSTFTEEGKQKKTKEIIYRYLGNTGLLYSGV